MTVLEPAWGLTSTEAKKRLAASSPNRIAPPRTASFRHILLEELAEPMIVLLLAVAAAYFAFGRLGEALVVFAIVLLILFVEVWTEFRAKRALSTLTRMIEPETWVIRDGSACRVAVENVVVGDVLRLDAGSLVPADARLWTAQGLLIDESALTGESVPVAPREEVFRGTVVVQGEALAEVVATGKETRIGQIASLAATARPPRTPLQRMMKELTPILAAIALGLAVLIPLLFVALHHMAWRPALLTGLSLAFATIPEELPIVITLVLALGSLHLARQHALVRDLRAAETLGHVTAVVTDKTGTLTENRLALAAWWPTGAAEPVYGAPVTEDPLPPLLFGTWASIGVARDGPRPIGDPIDRALWEALAPRIGAGDFRPTSHAPFTRERGWSGANWAFGDGSTRMFVKGLPEAVAALAGSDDAAAAAERLAAEGCRVLAVAVGNGTPGGWTHLGLIALADPLRPEAAGAISAVRSAGIRVYIATGDHPGLAQAVAQHVGLATDTVLTGTDLDATPDEELHVALATTSLFARIGPEHKLRLVQALQRQGHVVAMTGDGVNDAPALKAADVGVAMGRGGADAAREAAGLVLTDDRFATLEEGIHAGRRLFAKLRSAIRFYLAAKVAFVTAMLLPATLGLRAPLSPAMIIVLELFVDLAACTAMLADGPEVDLMKVPPRRFSQPFFDRGFCVAVFVGGLLVAVSALAAALLDPQAYASAAFGAWLLGVVFLAYWLKNWRPGARIGANGWLGSRVLNVWAGSTLAAAGLIIYAPPLQAALGTSALSLRDLAVVVLVAGMVLGIGGRWAAAQAL